MSNPGPVPPEQGDTWTGLSTDALPVAEVSAWVVRADTGAAVTFNGTARDHAGDRRGVSLLEYEAYESQVVPKLEQLVAEARSRWPELARVAILHRIGPVELGQSAVVVAVSSAHRGPSFEAGQWLIDTLKATVPIWKREEWDGGSSWGLEAQHLTEIGADVGRADS